MDCDLGTGCSPAVGLAGGSAPLAAPVSDSSQFQMCSDVLMAMLLQTLKLIILYGEAIVCLVL